MDCMLHELDPSICAGAGKASGAPCCGHAAQGGHVTESVHRHLLSDAPSPTRMSRVPWTSCGLLGLPAAALHGLFACLRGQVRPDC